MCFYHTTSVLQELALSDLEHFISFKLRSRCIFVSKRSLTLKFEPRHVGPWSLICVHQIFPDTTWRIIQVYQQFLSHFHTFQGKMKFSEVFWCLSDDTRLRRSPSTFAWSPLDLLLFYCYRRCSEPAFSARHSGALGPCSYLRSLLGNKMQMIMAFGGPDRAGGSMNNQPNFQFAQ